MKPSRPREERQFEQAQRGLGALRLLEDEFVMAWFSAEHERFVREMLSAELADDIKRREAATKIKALQWLRQHLETEAAFGKKALTENKNG